MKIVNVGITPKLEVDWSPRFNIITGDNGLGKSFLLDLAWWALTRTWAGNYAVPLVHPEINGSVKAEISYSVKGAAKSVSIHSEFNRAQSLWAFPKGRPPQQGIVVYVRVDGGFSVWDAARNYWRQDSDRPDAYHFNSSEVWDGLEINGQEVCEGLERDWLTWQLSDSEEFQALKLVLDKVSPTGEAILPGKPRRVFLGEGRMRPTIKVGGQEVPIALASAGMRRIIALSYFLVWSWSEHKAAAELLGKAPEKRFVILIDEPETHLHPRWQRTILQSVITAVKGLVGEDEPQVIVATHGPLILASLEPVFNTDIDDLMHLGLGESGDIELTQGLWAKQGDVTNWLVSESFDLKQARSLEAEKAIEAAEMFMRGDTKLPTEFKTRELINRQLKRLLADHDEFWPRWIVSSLEKN